MKIIAQKVLGWLVVGLLAATSVLVTGLWILACSTTGAEINGPTAGVALEYDFEGTVSPRIQVGYQSAFWYDMLGYGWGLNIGYAPLNERVDLFLEGQLYAVPLLGFPLTPLSMGLGGGWSPSTDLMLGGRLGFEGWLFMPPDACYPPLEGDWEGCPAGVLTSDDVVYPEWLPRVSLRVAMLGPVETDLEPPHVILQLGFDPVLADWQMSDSLPEPQH